MLAHPSAPLKIGPRCCCCWRCTGWCPPWRASALLLLPKHHIHMRWSPPAPCSRFQCLCATRLRPRFFGDRSVLAHFGAPLCIFGAKRVPLIAAGAHLSAQDATLLRVRSRFGLRCRHPGPSADSRSRLYQLYCPPAAHLLHSSCPGRHQCRQGPPPCPITRRRPILTSRLARPA